MDGALALPKCRGEDLLEKAHLYSSQFEAASSVLREMLRSSYPTSKDISLTAMRSAFDVAVLRPSLAVGGELLPVSLSLDLAELGLLAVALRLHERRGGVFADQKIQVTVVGHAIAMVRRLDNAADLSTRNIPLSSASDHI